MDKSRHQYGSDGDQVNLSGYAVDQGSQPATIFYQQADRPYDIVDLQTSAPTRLTTRTGEPDWLWLQSEIGEGMVTLSHQQLTLFAGQGVLIAPHTPYSFTPVGAHWHTSHLRFTGKMLPILAKAFADTSSLYFPVLTTTFTTFLSDHATLAPAEYHQTRGAQIIYDFLLALADQCPSGTASMQRLAEVVLARIYRDYQQPLTNQQLASPTNYSVQYVLQAFTATYHTTPRRVLANYRVAHAQLLLWQTPSLPLSKIAQTCGFSSEAYLIRAFKRQVHMTPGQFRDQLP